MKKVLAIVLALVMVLSIHIPTKVSADSTTVITVPTNGTTKTISIAAEGSNYYYLQFVPEKEGAYTVSYSGSKNIFLYLFKDDHDDASEIYTSSYEENGRYVAEMTFFMDAGRTYYYMVFFNGDDFGSSGTINLNFKRETKWAGVGGELDYITGFNALYLSSPTIYGKYYDDNKTNAELFNARTIYWYNDYTGEEVGYGSLKCQLSNIKQSGSYTCKIKFGATVEAEFGLYIRVYNINNAWPVGSGDEWRTDIYVPYGNSVELVVGVDAVDTSLVSYKWKVYDKTTSKYIDLETNIHNNYYVTDPVTTLTEYACEVFDEVLGTYNKWVYFNVHVDNNFSLSDPEFDPDNNKFAYMYKVSGSSFDLKPTVTANDHTDMTYLWTYYPAEGEWVEFYTDSPEYVTGPLNEDRSQDYDVFELYVEDRYGNYDHLYYILCFYPVRSISVNPIGFTGVWNTQEQLDVTITPENAVEKGVIWSSSDTEVAVVDENGLVTGLKPGYVEITATSVDGGLKATCSITLTKAPLPPNVPYSVNVSYSDSILSNEMLSEYEGWEFKLSDLGTVLQPGEPTAFEATYTGADKDYFEQITNTVWVTRANCEHEEYEVIGAVEPTCTEDGASGDKYCLICGDLIEESRTVPRLGHNYKTEHYDATCTEQGCDNHECTRCGRSYQSNVVPALGHDYVFVQGYEPTTDAPGMIDHYTCSRCGAYFDTELSEIDASDVIIPNQKDISTCNWQFGPDEYGNPSDTYIHLTKGQYWDYYGGTAKEYPIDVYDSGKKLVQGQDYIVTYENNINVGICSNIITGIGQYYGSITVEFQICFFDVPLTHNFQKAVYWAVDEGIAAGYPPTSMSHFFGVNDYITRGQVAMFLWRAAGQPAPVGKTQTFTDVPTTSNFYKAIQWAYEQGITGGYTGDRAGQFGPSDNCTRAQIVMFLWRYAGKPAPVGKTQTFTDVSTKSNFYKAVQWAYEQGITAGYSDGTFGVNRTCTRAYCVTFLYRLMVE